MLCDNVKTTEMSVSVKLERLHNALLPTLTTSVGVGRTFETVCLFVCLSVCLSVCPQHSA